MKSFKHLLIAAVLLPCGLSAQETISLDGEWSFWTPDHPQTTVNVPHTFNVMDGLESYAGKAFYSREVPVGPQQKGKKLRVQFNGVFHDAVVYVNGQKAGEHLNAGYTPFSFDITPFIDYSPGARNEMLVECDNSYSEDNLPCGSRFDWANDGGIYRSVSLHTSGAHSLRYVHVTPQIDLQDSTALAQFSIRLWEPEIRKADFRFRVTENRTDRTLFAQARTLRRTREGTFDVAFDCGKVELWHFDNPALYSFRVELLDGKAVSDVKEENFGFRTVTIDGDQLLLNGEPVRLPGIENMPGSNPDFGMAESYAYMEKTVGRMKDLNCTITRFHWAQDDYRLSLMDEKGILVQEEISWWQRPSGELTPAQMKTAKRQIAELVEAHYNHPCLFAWGMSNEVDDNRKDLVELGAFTRSLDPVRIVDAVSNSIWEKLENDPALVLDLPTWNEYMGTWHADSREDLLTSMPEVEKVLNGRPLLITEHGLCEPAFTGGDARRVDEMIFHISEWKKHPFICGYIYFSLEDYRTHMGEEGVGRNAVRRHGVCDKRLEPKASYYVLRQIMSPVAVSKVRKTDSGMDSIMCRDAEVTLQVSDDIPSYTLRGYSVRYVTQQGETMRIHLPDLAPGVQHEMILRDLNDGFNFDILRPDGSAVLSY